MKIKDVPISKKSSLGSMETLGEIHYHYQKYDNIFNFFDILMKKNDDIKKVLCIPDVGRKWMRSFLKVNLNKDNLDTSELMMKNGYLDSYFRNKKNIGPCQNMMTALWRSSGNFIWLLCDDDLPITGAIQEILENV